MGFKKLKYSEIKSNIYDKFIDLLVKNTSFSDVSYSDGDYDYVANIKFPFYDESYVLKFNNSNSWNMRGPARYHMEQMLMVVGVDSNSDGNVIEAIWEEYVDRLEIKINDFIKQFMEYEG
jgi:hypothetical protein